MRAIFLLLPALTLAAPAGAAQQKDVVLILAPRCTIDLGGKGEVEQLAQLQDLMLKAQGVAVRYLNKSRFKVNEPESEAAERVLEAQECEEDQCIVDIMEPLDATYAIGGGIGLVDGKHTLTWRLWRRDVGADVYRATAIASIEDSFKASKTSTYTLIKRAVIRGTLVFSQKLNRIEAMRKRKMYGSYASAVTSAVVGAWLFARTRSDLGVLRQAYVDASSEEEAVSSRRSLESAVDANDYGILGSVGLGVTAGALAYLGFVFGQE